MTDHRALLEEVGKVLEPFAKAAEKWPGHEGWHPDYPIMMGLVTLAELRRLVALLPKLTAALAEPAAPSVPEGWKLLPITPTEEMHVAARDWSAKKYGKPIGRDASDGCWRTMLSAAPAGATPEEGER